MEFLTLSINGVALAVVLAVAFLFLGFGLGPFFLIAMIVFLVLSAIVTYIGMAYKKNIGVGQEPRGAWNVLSNGLPALVMVFLFYLSAVWGYGWFELLSIIGFLASLAAITADKFGSEIGVLNGRPIMIFTLKKVRKGTSGGVTVLGLLAGLGAALLISLLILLVAGHLGPLTGYYGFNLGKTILVVTVSGFVGSLIDSALGYYEEKGIGNKFTSNLACGIAGGSMGMLLFAILLG